MCAFIGLRRPRHESRRALHEHRHGHLGQVSSEVGTLRTVIAPARPRRSASRRRTATSCSSTTSSGCATHGRARRVRRPDEARRRGHSCSTICSRRRSSRRTRMNGCSPAGRPEETTVMFAQDLTDWMLEMSRRAAPRLTGGVTARELPDRWRPSSRTRCGRRTGSRRCRTRCSYATRRMDSAASRSASVLARAAARDSTSKQSTGSTALPRRRLRSGTGLRPQLGNRVDRRRRHHAGGGRGRSVGRESATAARSASSRRACSRQGGAAVLGTDAARARRHAPRRGLHLCDRDVVTLCSRRPADHARVVQPDGNGGVSARLSERAFLTRSRTPSASSG